MLLWQINSCKLPQTVVGNKRIVVTYADLFKPAPIFYSCALDRLIDVFDRGLLRHGSKELIGKLNAGSPGVTLISLLIQKHLHYKSIEARCESNSEDNRSKLRWDCSVNKNDVWDWLMSNDKQGFGCQPKGSIHASLDYVLPLMNLDDKFKSEFCVSVTYRCSNSNCDYSWIDEHCPLCLFAHTPGPLKMLIQQTFSYRSNSTECSMCNDKTLVFSDVQIGSFVFLSMNGVKEIVRLLVPEETFRFEGYNFLLTGAVWNDKNTEHYGSIVKLDETSQYCVFDDLMDSAPCYDDVARCFEMLGMVGLDKICWLIYKKVSDSVVNRYPNNSSVIDDYNEFEGDETVNQTPVCSEPVFSTTTIGNNHTTEPIVSNTDNSQTDQRREKHKQSQSDILGMPKPTNGKINSQDQTPEDAEEQQCGRNLGSNKLKTQTIPNNQQNHRSKCQNRLGNTGGTEDPNMRQSKRKQKISSEKSQKKEGNASVTAEKIQKRQYQNRINMRRTRAMQTDKQKEQTNINQKERMAEKRLEETDSRRNSRNERARKMMARKRGEEKEEQRKARVDCERERIAGKRRNTTESQRKTRATCEKERIAEKRKISTESQRKTRATCEKERIAEKRKISAESQRKTRANVERERIAQKRKNASESERTARANIERVRLAQKRSKLKETHRTDSTAIDRERKAKKRKNETAEETITRVDVEKKRRAQSRKNETIHQQNNRAAVERERTKEVKITTHQHIDETIKSVIDRALLELNSEKYRSGINASLSEYCGCCHKILFEDRTYKVVLLNKSTDAVSVNFASALCCSCKRYLDRDEIPLKAVINNLYVDKVPFVLSTLTFLERRFVARVLTYMTMLVLPSGGQYGQKGMAIHFPSEPDDVVQILPQNCEKSGVVCISGKYESYIRPIAIFAALEWLKKHNIHYKDIIIDYNAFNFDENVVNEVLVEIEETGTIPVDYECPDISVSDFLKSDGAKVRFPRSTCQPVSLLDDATGSIEAQAFVCLYPRGDYTYGHAKQAAQRLTLLQFLQSRLLNIDNRFRLDISYLITAVNRYEASTAKSLIECYMRIRKPQKNDGESRLITASDIRNIKNNSDLTDNSLMWLKSIRGTMSYWKNQLWDLLAKIKCIGPPDVFVTLSSAEMYWKELRELLEKDMGLIDDINEGVRKNPVIVAMHIKRRFESLLNYICKSKILGCIDDHHVRVEFQNRGSVHFHCFFWIGDAPSIHKGSSAEDLCRYINKIICTTIPDESDTELRDLVLSRQIHSHSEHCIKSGSNKCRYRYPRPVCEETRLLNDSDLEKTDTSFYETKRTAESVCVNAYNPGIIRNLRAHMDIQLVYGAQGLAYYVCKYIMKAEPDELRTGLAKTLNEMQHNITTQKGRMLKLAMCVLKSRRMSAQEAAYRICNLPMIYSSRDVIKISTLLPEKRVKRLKTIAEIADLPDDTNDIFYDSMIDVYHKRSKRLEQESLFDIVSWYRKVSFGTPNSFPLLDESASLKRRRKFCCIRTSYLSTGTENYYYSLLLLHFPHRTDSELGQGYANYRDAFMAKHENFNFQNITNETFVNEVLETAQKIRVSDIMNQRFNENDDDTEDVLEEYSGDYVTGEVQFNVMQPMNDTFTDLDMTDNEQEEQQWQSLRVGETNVVKLERKFSCLNKDQMRAFKYVHKKLYYDKCQILMLLTGEAGSGKSYLLEVLRDWLRLTQSNLVGQDCVMIAAPTGIAAKQIRGKTLHSLLKLPIQKKGKFDQLGPLSHNILEKMKPSFYGKRFLIIDECSMVGQRMLIAINMRLCQIYDSEKPFGGIHVIMCGDYGQLKPVQDKATFECRDLFELLNPLWLMQNMRQGNDNQWHTLLNHIRIAELNDDDEKLLQSRLFSHRELESNTAIRIYPTIKLVQAYNVIKQSQLDANVTKINAIDVYSANDIAPNCTVFSDDVPTDERECGGLPHVLNVTINTRVMCIKNIGFGLVNGDMGFVQRITHASDGSVDKIYVKFDDPTAGKELQVDGAVPFDRSVTEFEYHGRQINRYQFPMIACWAITVHKSQGLSLDAAVMNIGKSVFQAGMTYVALSRIRTINGVFIESEPMHDIIASACKPNKSIAELTLDLMYKYREIKKELRHYKVEKFT